MPILDERKIKLEDGIHVMFCARENKGMAEVNSLVGK
jgi:hypothetical protein